jgi:hypothetical protein
MYQAGEDEGITDRRANDTSCTELKDKIFMAKFFNVRFLLANVVLWTYVN